MNIFRGNKGYTLLFAVIVSTVVLAVATFILSISRKQFILASSSRDSVSAFYAADSGIECAVFNLSKFATSTESAESQDISCDNGEWSLDAVGSSRDLKSATSTFYMPIPYDPDLDGITGPSCVKVVVVNISDGDNSTTTIESRGYNIGWDATESDCSKTGPRKVERGLRLIYY